MDGCVQQVDDIPLGDDKESRFRIILFAGRKERVPEFRTGVRVHIQVAEVIIRQGGQLVRVQA